MRRFFLILFFLVLLLPTVSAEISFAVDSIRYRRIPDVKRVEVVSNEFQIYTGNVRIPDRVFYDGTIYRVVGIADSAFFRCQSLKSVSLPNSIQTIGAKAFYRCTGLTSVTIPYTVTSIGFAAFSKCKMLNSLTISSGTQLKFISDDAFKDCSSLVSLNIPTGVKSIGSGAFASCTGLTTVNISSSVDSIGETNDISADGAFEGCTALTSISIPSSVVLLGNSTFKGCTSLSTVNLPESIKYLGGEVFDGTKWYASQPDGLVYQGRYLCNYKGNMPPKFKAIIKDGTVAIAGLAFYNCQNMDSVSIPNSVITIGNNAFFQCDGLSSVKIPDKLISVGASAFEGCEGLTSMVFSPALERIDNEALKGCRNLLTLSIPGTTSYIGSSVIQECMMLRDLTCPADLLNKINDKNNVDIDLFIAKMTSNKLESVVINNGCLNRTALKVIAASHRTLKTLDLNKATNTELKYEFLENMKSIEHLLLPANFQRIIYKY